jgi:hypothetical protein
MKRRSKERMMEGRQKKIGCKDVRITAETDEEGRKGGMNE